MPCYFSGAAAEFLGGVSGVEWVWWCKVIFTSNGTLVEDKVRWVLKERFKGPISNVVGHLNAQKNSQVSRC